MKEARCSGYRGPYDGSRRSLNLRIVEETEEGWDERGSQSNLWCKRFPEMERHTEVISICNGWMSAFDSAWINCSSQRLLTVMYTTKPRRSRSRESDRVSGALGGPANTTTSVLCPFLALLALLFIRFALL